MHPISDKELDKLFQQRFEEAHFPPSEDLWSKIAEKMDRKKTVKIFPVFWMAAASVIVVIGAGLWFYRPVEVIRLQGNRNQLAKNSVSDIGAVAESPVLESIEEVNNFNLKVDKVGNQRTLRLKEIEPVTGDVSRTKSEQPNERVASNGTPQRSVQEISQPQKEAKVPAKYAGDQSKLDVTQQDMIAKVEIPEDNTAVEEETSSPRKIRSIGSLVNFVVSKVDHREDKIIEFKDGEEGSQVSGINLGVVKLKSRIK